MESLTPVSVSQFRTYRGKREVSTSIPQEQREDATGFREHVESLASTKEDCILFCNKRKKKSSNNRGKINIG